MSVKMKFGSKDIPFVYKGDKLVYPNPIKDGLLLWYDFKGMRNTDTNKEVAKDLSGNGNDGTLVNFNFTEESGYKDNTLVFDGVDDKLIVPELVLDETAMSVEIDGKTYVYDGNKVMSVDGGYLEFNSRNLLRNSDFSQGNKYWNGDFKVNQEKVAYGTGKSGAAHLSASDINHVILKENTEYIYAMRLKLTRETRQTTAPVHYHYYDTSASDAAEVHYLCDINGDRLGSSLILPENEWITVYRYAKTKQTFVSEKAVFRPYFYALPEGVDYEIDWMYFIESGKPEEEWAPAPEDFTESLLENKNLENFKLYNKSLNKEELLHNYTKTPPKQLKPGIVVQDGLVLHYDFSHESNTSEYKDKAFDYSGNGNHGVLNNFNFTEESGYKGGGLKFDGVDDLIEVPSFNREYIDDNTEFNFDFSLNLANAVSRGSVVTMPFTDHRLSIKNSEDRVAIGRYTTHWFGRRTPPLNRGDNHFSINVILLGESEYELNEPSFLLEVYVNGELVEDVYASSTDYYSNVAQHLYVGWQGTNQSQANNAYLDENLGSLKIYRRTLSAEEIQHNYAIEKEKFNIE